MKGLLKRNQSVLIALGITVALAIWLLSGTGATGSARDPSLEAPRVDRPPITRVRVRVLEARPVTPDAIIYGKTEAARGVTLRAEIDGRIVAVGAKRGARVNTGDMIVRLDVRDREARLLQARALVDQRKIQYQAARRLKTRNFQSESDLAEARANLGDFIAEGKEIARVIELDPILVTGDVTQRELDHLKVGARGSAKLITGEELEGVVRYVASEADEATRTYRVELEVENADRSVVAGTTAEMRIPAETVSAHFVSPALLSLNGRDEIGIKSVDDDGKVVFHAVDIVRTGADGVWITGLPDRVRVITVGQGFVREGDRVEAHAEDRDA